MAAPPSGSHAAGAPEGSPPAGMPTRAFTPIQNPTYVYNDDDSWKPSPVPHHVLEQPPGAAHGEDPRLTSQGTRPPVSGLPHFVPAAYQTLDNVWELPQ